MWALLAALSNCKQRAMERRGRRGAGCRMSGVGCRWWGCSCSCVALENAGAPARQSTDHRQRAPPGRAVSVFSGHMRRRRRLLVLIGVRDERLIVKRADDVADAHRIVDQVEAV